MTGLEIGLIIGGLIWAACGILAWLIVAGGAARQVDCEHGVAREDCPECRYGGNANG